MNFLSLFVLIPVLMLGGLLLASDIKQIRAVCATGASLLLLLAVALTVLFLGERNSGNTAEMLFTASSVWYAPFHIHYSVGVDGISVAMLLLSSIIVFTGIFTSWKMELLPREYFMWFCLLSIGVSGFFISTDLFTMFMQQRRQPLHHLHTQRSVQDLCGMGRLTCLRRHRHIHERI